MSMEITNSYNNYATSNTKNSKSKKDSNVTTSTVEMKTSTHGVTRTEQIKTGYSNVNDYSKYLQEKYSYMNTGTTSMQGVPTTVSVSGAFLKKCMNNPEKATYLEENLAAIPECAKMAVNGSLGTLISLSYQIDANGNITCISSGTNDPDGKIYNIQFIPWLINFFLYGSFNNYKEKENFLKNIVNFIDLGLNTDHINFLNMISLTPELKHFIFDFLFTEYCKKPENEKEKLNTFDYLEHLESNNLLQKLIKDHADIKDKIKDSCISNELSNEPNLALPEKVINNPDTYDPFNDKSISIIKNVFKEIEEIEESIKNYE